MEILSLEDIKWLFKDYNNLFYVDPDYKIVEFRTVDKDKKDNFINIYKSTNNKVIGNFYYYIGLIPINYKDFNVLGYRTQSNNIVYPWPLKHLNKPLIEQWYVNFTVIRTKVVRT